MAVMKRDMARLDSLILDPANVRSHPARNLEAIKASLARFGQQKPIVVDGDGIVRAGNGTVMAARDLGWSDVWVVRTKLKGVEAAAFAIADNRSAELATWDDPALARTLEAIRSEPDFPIGATGFEDAEVDALLEGIARDATGYSDGLGGLGDDFGDDEETGRAEPLVYSDEQVIEVAFRWFRENGFPYREIPAWKCMTQINRLASTPDDSILRTVVAYQVADTYHRHRFHAAAEGMHSPFESFGNDDSLRKAMRLSLEHGKDVETVLCMVNGTQACSNFRPGFACKLYRDYCRPGMTVLDTSTGYGGRLVGFMASRIAGRYIGIDPNVPTHEANLRMAADLGFADRVELHNLPAEDVPHDVVAGRCDFAFTSPPYFRKEHYSDDGTQSWVRYGTAEAWRAGFLLPMLRLQFAALKPGRHAIVNIADVKIKDKVYPLAAWTVAMGEKAGFRYVRTDQFPLGKEKRFGSGHDDTVATEPVIVFVKPS